MIPGSFSVFSDVLGIRAAFYGRQGGASSGVYDSLNCGLGTQDSRDNVLENRHRVVQDIAGQTFPLLSPYQVHGIECLAVTKVWNDDRERPKGDALVTDRAGLVLGILTADCAPVLFAGQKPDGSPVIGAAHAGWKGALAGILDSTVFSMQRLGADKNTLQAVIGPCIAQSSYQVGKDFYQEFMQRDQTSHPFFQQDHSEKGRFLFDLPGYVAHRLSEAGVKDVKWTGQDTCADETGYFSHRRSTRRQETECGRQLSCMVISG